MNVIENFSLLSKQEQRAFAEALIKTINSERTFIDGHPFEIYEGNGGIYADEVTGDLTIDISHQGLIEVDRVATWQDDSPELYDLEFYNTVEDDAKKVFKTLEAIIDGYKVTLDIADTDSKEITNYKVDSKTSGDSGIGSYEYWGTQGYDSHPYTESAGVVTINYDLAIYLTVEPAVEETAPEIEED